MFNKVVLALSALSLVATSSFAAIQPADAALIITGIQGADAVYYQIGGAILIVLAGIWGFKMVKRLF